MNAINSDNLISLDQFNTEPKQQLYEASQVSLSAVSRKQSADVTLVTKEGDKVTLSVESSFEAACGTYDSQARMNGAYAATRGRFGSSNFEREITIRVEGDLNQAEKNEIKQVLGKIFKMVKKFFSGETDKPVASAVKGIKLDQLVHAEAKFEVSQNVLEVKRVSAEYATNTSTPADDSDLEITSMDRLVDRMSKAIRDAKVENEKFLRYFGHQPSKMVENFMELEPDARKMNKTLQQIMERLFKRIENKGESSF